MRCFLCNHELPQGGQVYFHAPGNYGSQVWDPLDGRELTIAFCDGCLLARRAYVEENRPQCPVLVDGVRVGWLPLNDTPSVPWNPARPMAGPEEPLLLEVADLVDPERWPDIRWTIDPRLLVDYDLF